VYNRSLDGSGLTCGRSSVPEFINRSGVNLLESHEALIGTRVRVLESDDKPELWGMVGTIEQRYGHRDYIAVDVRLDDGRSQLFWAYGLEAVEEEKAFRA
jgi:hypothetical protein